MKIKCKNCGNSIEATYNKNRYGECFKGDCYTCGWKFILKDTEFDYVQPDNPLFEVIYKYRPGEEVEKNKKIHAWEEEQKKAKLEEKYHKTFKKPWERRAIEKEVLKNE